MRSVLTARVQQEWGKRYLIRRLFELKEENQDKCVIIGTLFKHQDLKPSILKELSEENNLVPQPPRSHFADDADRLILEDELQRIRLVGNINIHQLITGVVCAVLGYEVGDGRFYVDEIIYSEGGIQRPLTMLKSRGLLLLMSGISLASREDCQLSLQLVGEWLAGMVGEYNNIVEASKVVRVIIAGNSIRSSNEVKQKSRSTRPAESQDTLNAVFGVDNLLEGLCHTIPVDIMPGEFDPCNYMLPQQPLHHCLFPKTHTNGALQGVTNPYHCVIGDCDIIGSSGQPIQNILNYSRIENSLEALKLSLKWGHLAPTAPDTLPCYPYHEEDPFIIKEMPHVYFVGNCAEFQTELHIGPTGAKTRLVCIPEFHKKQMVGIVNLDTLDCVGLSFSVED